MIPLRDLRVTSYALQPRCAPRVVPSTFLLSYFWAFLGGPGGGTGGAPGTVPLQNPQVTSRKACLRNADFCVSPIKGFWKSGTCRPRADSFYHPNCNHYILI